MPRPKQKRARPHREEAEADDDERTVDMADAGDSDELDEAHSRQAWRLPAGYDDRNRAFLQAFLAHGALTFRQAQHLLAAILNVGRQVEDGDGGEDGEDGERQRQPLKPEEIIADDMREFVGKAQQALAPLDFDIRSAVDPGRRERVWVLVSTDADPKAHLAVLFTPRKLAFVHRLLTALFDTYNTPRLEALCLTEQQALKLSRPPRPRASDAGSSANNNSNNRDKGLKHSVVLSLLQSLVRQGWLDRSPAGFYALSTRALLELEPLLLETFQDADADTGTDTNTWQRIKYCAACRELVTAGLRCPTLACSLRLHDHCEAAFWRTQRQRACPRCQAAWPRDSDDTTTAARSYVGERAITTTDVYKRKKRQGRPSDGVDELMRTLLPKTAAVSMPLGRPAEEAEEDENE